jgi:uncharacterized protein YlxW (UPF0749 family)
MKNNEASLFLFIATIIIGILISLNINFNRLPNRVFLTTKQYQDAYKQRNKLRADISDLKEQYFKYSQKLSNLQFERNIPGSVPPEIEEELMKNKMILGQLDIEGEGINITLKDGSNDLFFLDEDDPYILDRIIHNYDITYVINDLKNAGAEAISVNGQRVIDRSEVICDGALLNINGVKIASPFYINAIGNKEVLKKYMLDDQNYLKYMISRSIFVEVNEANTVKIQAYTHEIDKNFINVAK